MEWVQNNPRRCGARRLQKSYTAMEPEQGQCGRGIADSTSRPQQTRCWGDLSLNVLPIVALSPSTRRTIGNDQNTSRVA